MTGIIEVDSDRGKNIGFTSDRFSHDSYLWKIEQYIYISFIESLQKGNFHKLVTSITDQGLGVKVPTPLGRMVDIVMKSGYKKTTEGECEIWVLEKK